MSGDLRIGILPDLHESLPGSLRIQESEVNRSLVNQCSVCCVGQPD